MIMNERGLTLAEILVAVAIIGLGLAALAVVVPVATYGVQEGNQLSTATFLAEQRLEQARNAAWTTNPAVDCLGLSANSTAAPTLPVGATCTGLAAGATTFPDENNVQWGSDTRAGASTTAPVAGGYTRTMRIAQCTAGTCGGVANADLRLVTVTVRYLPLSGVGGSATTKAVALDWVVSKK